VKAPSLREVLGEIDFELAQGLAVRPELRKALRDVRALHQRTRSALFGENGERIDVQEALSRQFQINDMILAILGDAVEAAYEARSTTRRVEEYVRAALSDMSDDLAETDAVAGTSAVARRAVAEPTAFGTAAVDAPAVEDDGPWEPELDPLIPVDEPDVDPEEEIAWAMKPERLWIAMDPRTPRLPLVGTLLRRFRDALHMRVLIYAGQLADKQGAVNRILGDHLLRALEALHVHAKALDSLRLRVRRLEASRERRRRPREIDPVS
jgi:hypothetical protein